MELQNSIANRNIVLTKEQSRLIRKDIEKDVNHLENRIKLLEKQKQRNNNLTKRKLEWKQKVLNIKFNKYEMDSILQRAHSQQAKKIQMLKTINYQKRQKSKQNLGNITARIKEIRHQNYQYIVNLKQRLKNERIKQREDLITIIKKNKPNKQEHLEKLKNFWQHRKQQTQIDKLYSIQENFKRIQIQKKKFIQLEYKQHNLIKELQKSEQKSIQADIEIQKMRQLDKDQLALLYAKNKVKKITKNIKTNQTFN